MVDNTNNGLADFKLDKELDIKKKFPIPSYTDWKAKVEKDLKGASFEKKTYYQNLRRNKSSTNLH